MLFRRRFLLILLVVAVFLASGCAGPDPNLTETGAGKPTLTAGFPETAAPGEVITLTLEVANPGPQDMDSTVVSFVRVGDPSLPEPIVEPRKGRSLSGIEAIRPEPRGDSPAEAIYAFEGIPEGGSLTIEFDLRLPEAEGAFGNSVQVYDGAEVDRRSGIRLLIEVA